MIPRRPPLSRLIAAAVLAAVLLPAAARAEADQCRFFDGLAFREAAQTGAEGFFEGVSRACNEARAALDTPDAALADAAASLIATLAEVRGLSVRVISEGFAAQRRDNEQVWGRVQTLGVSLPTVYFIARDAEVAAALQDWQLAKTATAQPSKS